MHEPNVETRTYFHSALVPFCNKDRVIADDPPIEAVCEAALEIRDRDSAERFLAGMLHWLRGKRSRTMREAFTIAKSNLRYCLDSELFSDEQVVIWNALLIEYGQPLPKEDDPKLAQQRSTFIGAQLRAGKDPALTASLAKKALLKRGAVG